jgi:hypothetical protein
LLRIALASCLLPVSFVCNSDSPETPARLFPISEQREPCKHYNPLRNAYFGDLHAHTAYSQDASTQGTRNTPFDAYEFAKGQKVGLQPYAANGEPQRFLQIERPLDFVAVTDHAEQLGEVKICNTPGMEGYDSWVCRMYRWTPRVAFFVMNSKASMGGGERFGFCGKQGELCLKAAKGPWQEIQRAAEIHYDRSSACEFTTFVGYEWTGAEDLANLHRNIIFRNDSVPALPISFIEADNAQKLWDSLETECMDAASGCDAITIPHNSNLSDGLMFQMFNPDGRPISKKDAEQRARHETLVEMMQHKGSSECYYGRSGFVENDELCSFEQLPYHKFSGKFFDFTRELPRPDAGFMREVLRDGLREEARVGANPFKVGFIGGSDTHMATPGAVEEVGFAGHGGAGVPANKTIPPGLVDDLEFNPGGLSVLWAEENSRDALFEAMRRREAYGTSGPRIQVRFFGAWDYADDLCQQQDFVSQAYEHGVPMGGDLPVRPDQGGSPVFAVSALQDAGTLQKPGNPLQRIQIIKGWVDARGNSHEKVVDIAGDPENGASVRLDTCQPVGKGFSSLCSVWRDADFDASQRAFYYARVVENPSCRWSQYICVANKVNCDNPHTIGEGLEACCSESHKPTIQERAWTSPIWYSPSADPAASAATDADS